MEDKRIRIADIAESLGLSTATVSNVIHGKTGKISDETVKRVQRKIEETGYIPNMAGILLAQNNSRIIGVVINDNEKYEGKVLEDGFVMASLNALSRVLNEKGYFLMIKITGESEEIPKFASMWNMDGLILMGFCEADYEALRNRMRISFVVYDGYFPEREKIVNLTIDHALGGELAGAAFKERGFEKALCIADNYICMDKERIEGFKRSFAPGTVIAWEIPKLLSERECFYEQKTEELKHQGIHAVFAVSDYYALDFMRFFQNKGIAFPEEISLIGFDDSRLSRESIPALTTIRQDPALRARTAVDCLERLRDGRETPKRIVLPVELIERESIRGKKNEE